MAIVLNDEGLEATLIEVAGPGAAAKGMPTLRMRERQEAHVVRKILAAHRP